MKAIKESILSSTHTGAQQYLKNAVEKLLKRIEQQKKKDGQHDILGNELQPNDVVITKNQIPCVVLPLTEKDLAQYFFSGGYDTLLVYHPYLKKEIRVSAKDVIKLTNYKDYL